MKICVAQTRPVKGDVQSNVANHKQLIDLAVSAGADTIVFPELSITGYEPELAEELATDESDSRFDGFQKIADDQRVTIGIGAPTKNGKGVCISTIVFQPHKARQTYSKKYLHSDEEPFFTGGQSATNLISDKPEVALAICYELSIPAHAEESFNRGAKTYAASVAKTADGVDRAIETLSGIASNYSMTVLMSNCVGPCGGFESAGRSSIWDSRGSLVGQLDDAGEGVLILDTNTREVTMRANNFR